MHKLNETKMDMLCVCETNRKGNNGIISNEDGLIFRDEEDEHMQWKYSELWIKGLKNISENMKWC